MFDQNNQKPLKYLGFFYKTKSTLFEVMHILNARKKVFFISVSF